ncbi:GTP pyrophosphokinase [Dermatobacter hominis]|uniref:GTP pyrophosphokinase n=1 Tax=Dermatobacter hominis TaxID=2884263 RepID=UPI001D0F5CD3|nr:RelA/SpoT domain-containing protein [Dermatobacter hominis]UDY36738.1 RelA/SpoT domain-containing protein [Dermatobacter hominis]
MIERPDDAPGAGLSFDYAGFGRWYDSYRVEVLDPALVEVEAVVGGLLRDALSERDLARIRGPVGRVKSKPRAWRKLSHRRYVDRIDVVDDIPDVIDDLVGIRLTCTNRRDIDVAREVLDALPVADDGRARLWLAPDSERDYLDRPRPSGYRGWHVNLGLAVDVGGSRQPVSCELQVRTLLQDGWGELTHEDTYKKDGELPPLVEVLSRRMADLLSTLDDIAEDLRDELDRLDEAAVTSAPLPLTTETEGPGRRAAQAADAAAYLGTRWRALDRPVDLAALAWELQRDHGAEITDDWFGFGTFKRFLSSAVPAAEITTGRNAYILPADPVPEDDAADDAGADEHDGDVPDGDVGGHAESDQTTRHGTTGQGTAGPGTADEAEAAVPAAARALHRVDRTFPLLGHDDWTRLFDHLAEAWRRTGAQPPTDRLARRLIQSTRDRSAASGPPLAARHVEAVVRDLVAEGDGVPRPADELAGTYATLVQQRLVELRLIGARNRNARAAVRRWIAF